MFKPPTKTEARKHYNTRLPIGLMDRVAKAARKAGCTVTAWVEAALRASL